MPKKRTKTPPKAELTVRQIKFPSDWVERINHHRGDVSFSDFVRQAVLDKIGSEGLSTLPGWGGNRKGGA